MMDDDKHIFPTEPRRVSIEEEYEVRYWTATLGVTVHELKNAVQAVGKRPSDVREYLGR